MGAITDIVKAGVEPISKLVDAVSRGIGRAYDPRHKKKMADATVYEINALAEAMRQNNDLPIQIIRDGVQIDISDYKALAERANSRLVFQEMRKQQNIESIVEKAYKEVETFSEVSSDPVDDDWIVRFFNSVEDVSNEKLQTIWGKLLAGEIKQPHSFPLRTLEVLKNLSCEEAALFEKISFCILCSSDMAFIPLDRSLWNKFGIVYRNILDLSDPGIINLAYHGIIFNLYKDDEVVSNDRVIGFIKNPDKQPLDKIEVPVYSLTEAGCVLLKIIRHQPEKSENFAIEFVKLLKANNKKKYNISAHRIKEKTDNGFEYDPEDLA